MLPTAVTDRVITSPTFAFVGSELLEAMVTFCRVGTVSSYSTAVPSVVEVTVVPAFPDKSKKSIVKSTSPSEFPLSIVKAPNQESFAPDSVAFRTLVDGIKTTVGSAIRFSFALKLKVTISPCLA